MSAIPLLAPLFQGRWRAHGEAVTDMPPAGPAVTVDTWLRKPAALGEVLHRHARSRQSATADLPAAASRWTLDYLNALLPPVAAAASVLRHVLPVSPEHTRVTLDAQARPHRFHLPPQLGLDRPHADTATRYDALLRRHLAPLFAAIGAQAGLPAKVLWRHAAQVLDAVLVEAQRLAAARGDAGLSQGIGADRLHLLGPARWEGGQVNPMRQPLACCLFHRLPGRGRCSDCPLAGCPAPLP
jgi:ferric iron reductase protein FhuF